MGKTTPQKPAKKAAKKTKAPKTSPKAEKEVQEEVKQESRTKAPAKKAPAKKAPAKEAPAKAPSKAADKEPEPSKAVEGEFIGKGEEPSPKAETKTKTKKDKKTKAPKEPKTLAPVGRTLNVLSKIISTQLANTTMSSIKIGEALEEAKGRFEKSKEWLVWAEEAFGFGKTATYGYAKIAQVFNTPELQDKFKDLNSRTLTRLSETPSMLEDATKAIEEGEPVTAEWLDEWQVTKTDKPLKKDQVKASKKAKTESEEEEGTDDLYVNELEGEIEELKAQVEKLSSMPDKVDTESEEPEAGVFAGHFLAVAERMRELKPLAALNLHSKATKAEINASKRDLSKLYHPDIYGADVAPVHEAIQEQAKAAISKLK